ncbi:MAG: hypothetical protein ABIQ93_13110 [Saprospiraceae bacterium]
MKWRVWLAIGILIFPSIVEAGFGFMPDGRIDQAALRGAYVEGEFDKVMNVLEAALKSKRKMTVREDRIFTEKYLGVIYAADSSTYPKAESHFYQVLELAPSIELADMFVSQRVQDFFARVKTDFLKNKSYAESFDQYGNPLAAKPSPPASVAVKSAEPKPPRPSVPDKAVAPKKAAAVKPSESSRTWLWIGVSAITVGLGTGYYLWSRRPSEPAPKNIVVDGGQ